jgi:hypothetical protein
VSEGYQRRVHVLDSRSWPQRAEPEPAIVIPVAIWPPQLTDSIADCLYHRDLAVYGSDGMRCRKEKPHPQSQANCTRQVSRNWHNGGSRSESYYRRSAARFGVFHPVAAFSVRLVSARSPAVLHSLGTGWLCSVNPMSIPPVT